MSQAKIQFIEELQNNQKPLWPYDISQLVRQRFAWISLYRADPDLDPEICRGYMVRPATARAHSPEDPAAFWCVIAARQTMGWQNLIWTKEILQALDSEDALTSDAEKLGKMLEMREVHVQNGPNTPANVVADRNGFTLALGCAIPRVARDNLRTSVAEHGGLDQLQLAELASYVPEEYIGRILDLGFEPLFERALKEIG